MGYIYQAAEGATSNSTDEQHYTFLKKLTEVLGGLGSQLCALWGKDDGPIVRPANFSTYLEALLRFTSHPSLTLTKLANNVWLTLLKHDHISKDPMFMSYIPKLVECLGPKIVRVIN